MDATTHISLKYLALLLLTLIPLLITLALFFLVFLGFTHNKLTRSFFLFLIPFAFWQTNELLNRLSESSQEVLYWCHLLNPFVNLIPSVGMHLIIVFTRLNKLKKPLFLGMAIYMPSLFFFLCNYGGLISFQVYYSPVWRWIYTYERTPMAMINAGWLLVTSLLMLVMLLQLTFFTAHQNKTLRKQAIIIFMGLLIPAILSITTEFIFPFLLNWQPIPFFTSIFTFFPVSVFIALNKYELFMFSPKYAWAPIIENMNDGIVIIDSDGVLQYVHPFVLNLTGYSQEELLNKNSLSFLADNENRNLLRQYIHFRKKEVFAKYMLSVKRKDAQIIICQISVTPYFDKKNKVIGSVGIVEDISENIELGKALDGKINELNLFIYRTYHELRGPLASIEGLCNLALTETEKDDLKKYVQLIYSGTLKMDHVLRDLQRVSLLSHSKIEPKKVDVYLEIESLKEAMKTLKNFPKIIFTTQIQLKDDLIIDRVVLITILENLLTNAVNYADLGKSISFVNISVKQKFSKVEITVEDNGIGIPEEYQTRVWDMFFRANESVKGTGLGLYIAKRGAERLKGCVSLISKPKLGSVFKLVLTSFAPAPVDLETIDTNSFNDEKQSYLFK